MFFLKHKYKSGTKLTQHNGIFRSQLSLFEGVALIVSGTVGAGVLGIPYAIAQSGIRTGIIYIIVIGLLMMGLNLMVGEVVIRTKGTYQLVGLAKKYLGRGGQFLMTMVLYSLLFGVLTIYIIGEGETLAALFGGSSFEWSIGFFIIGALLVSFGLKTVKTIELFLTAGILAVLVSIAAFSVGHVDVSYWGHFDAAHALLPYGVVLFALYGATAIPEVHATLLHKDKLFKKSIVIAGSSIITLYIIFSLVVVGVTGLETTEIATIGLGNVLGQNMFIFGNVFAFFAMATSFLLVGVALRDSLTWDYKIRPALSTIITLTIPFLLFLVGIRGFIAAIDIVGGVFVSIEVLLVLLIYWRAKQLGDLDPGKYKLHHASLLGVVLAVVFALGAVYSVWNLF
jgi:tyrosine-specific transport protein